MNRKLNEVKQRGVNHMERIKDEIEFVGSSELLDMLYDVPDGERCFIELCEDMLKRKIRFDKTIEQYEVL